MGTFQQRVAPWMDACFGAEISGDRLERGDRFIEEAIELLQANGYPRERIGLLVDYVYDREPGDPVQEVGGVMVTLAAYCLALRMDMHLAGETELGRVWTKIDKIRAKQAAKPTGSALPIALTASDAPSASLAGWNERESAVRVPGDNRSALRTVLAQTKAILPGWEKNGATSLTIMVRGLIDELEQELPASPDQGEAA